MMEANHLLPEIRVEGSDDLHSIQELLHRHKILCSTAKLTIPGSALRIIELGTVEQLEDSIPKAIRAAGTSALGFVLDADREIKKRWEGLRSRLKSAEVSAPPTIPQAGFIGTNQSATVRVGIWLMPDNNSLGNLEDFLQRLISEGDSLISHAIQATDLAKSELEAKFIDNHRTKAIVHAWLAWQQEPGKPFGLAIKSGYFQKDAALALTFVNWIRELCQIQ